MVFRRLLDGPFGGFRVQVHRNSGIFNRAHGVRASKPQSAKEDLSEHAVVF